MQVLDWTMERDEIMTPEEFEQKMIELSMMDDKQDRHEAGDSLMQEMLTQLGYGEGVKVFEEFDKWYA